MDTFSTKILIPQAQKKVLRKMASKTLVDMFVDDSRREILDELFQATKEYTRPSKNPPVAEMRYGG